MCLTCWGVQVHFQQMPSLRLCAGNLKTCDMNFQSDLTSTRQDLCTAVPAFLFVSDLSHGLLSCLALAGWPVASTSRDHFTTDMMSCHVLGPFCFSPKHVMGILMWLFSPVRPGRLSDKTANDSDLSQLHGHSSPHKPKPSSTQSASCSHESKCSNDIGSKPSVDSSLSHTLRSCSTCTISCGR